MRAGHSRVLPPRPLRARLRHKRTAACPSELGAIWDAEHVSPPLPPLLDHKEVVRRLDRRRVAIAGHLCDGEGRRVDRRTFDQLRASRHRSLRRAALVADARRRVDRDSQRSSTSSTIFAVIVEEPAVERILSRLTLHVVPMLNPDGAERFERRNAQSIDINRDALRLQTPEGKVLKALRDRLNPRIGFNLHNQSGRTSVGTPPRPASISLLSVAYDEARTENAGRKLTKQICAVIRDALEPFAPDQIGRYDDEFEVRAFGDNITLWGTPVVLIETGPSPSPEPDAALVRLNFVALVSALDALASGSVERADPRAVRNAAGQRVEALLRARQERHGDQRHGHPAVHRRHRSRSPAVASRSPTAGGNCRRR